MTSSGELCLLHRDRRGLGKEGIHRLKELVNDRVETANPSPSFYLTSEEEGDERPGLLLAVRFWKDAKAVVQGPRIQMPFGGN